MIMPYSRNKVYRAVQGEYLKCMLKAEFLIKTALGPVLMLLRKRNVESDCVKTFDSYSYSSYSSYIMAVSNIFKQSNVSMGNVTVEYLILM